ncbi:MAG: tyrosine--tRNA ligase [Mycoplasmataceae bacterium]|nr:tyrosine--tRNA ligase [Mycoplasmataceae bacterium]
MSFIAELKWRGLLNNITNQTKIQYFEEQHGGTYIGFDPSSDSLHLGNYIMILILRWLKKFGHKPIAVIGGATGQIGDPSGKKTERTMLDIEKAKKNVLAIQEQLKKYADVEIFDNAAIYKNTTLFDFLRNVGKLINVNYLLEKDIIKSRLESGISYSEFSYNLIQGYDFAWLYHHKSIVLQIGGSDQWGNITTGIEIIRKMYGDNNHACGLTISLLTKADGSKFGKTENGAIFLDKKYTSPFMMYQFLYNQSDADVDKLLKCLTMLEQKDIKDIIQKHNNAPFKRIAQTRLTQSVLTDIHGEHEYQRCLKISNALFKGNIEQLEVNELYDALTSLPSFVATEHSYNITDLLVLCGACISKSESRKLIQTNSIYVNNKLINSFDTNINQSDSINNKFSYIKKGKKNYFLIKW